MNSCQHLNVLLGRVDAGEFAAFHRLDHPCVNILR